MTRDRVPSAAHAVACALLVLLGSEVASAQRLAGGGRVGLTMSTVRTEGEGGGPAFGRRVGATVGGFLAWPIAGIELQVEGLVAQKGARLDEGGIDARLLIDYLEVPVLARFSRRGLGGRIYVAAGPAFASRLRARTRAEFSGATEEVDATGDVRRRDLGIVGAAGFEWRRMVVDGRYTHGLVDVDTDDTDAVSVRNRAVSLTAGITF